MKKFLIAATLIFSILLSACNKDGEMEIGPPAPLDAVPDIVGEYAVNGFDPLGTEYSGRLSIFPGDTANTYKMQWIIVGSIQEGDGRLDGNTLTVQWHSDQNMGEQSQGTAVYTVSDNGVLDGVRTTEGYPKEGTETAYPNE